MTKLLQTLMDGMAVGSLYALIALGYTMVYGILQFINFAHSDVFMLGAWLAYVVSLAAGWGAGPPGDIPTWLWWAMLTPAVLGPAAMAYDRWLRDRLARSLGIALPTASIGRTLLLVGAWGLAIFGLVYVARWFKLTVDMPLASGFVILICGMAACGLIGFLIEWRAYRPLRSAPRLNVLITAIGVSLFLENLGQLKFAFGTQPQRMPSVFPDRVLYAASFGGVPVNIRLVDVLIFAVAVVLMVGLERLVFGTKLGRAMRAVSYDTRLAALMGIPVDFVISFTFVVGSMLAAAAGFLYAAKYPGLNQSAAAQWILLGLKAFVAAVVGGIGNIRGAMLGGLLIGLIELFGAAYVSSNLRDVYVFSILIIVLLVKPAGLLGRPYVEKV